MSQRFLCGTVLGVIALFAPACVVSHPEANQDERVGASASRLWTDQSVLLWTDTGNVVAMCWYSNNSGRTGVNGVNWDVEKAFIKDHVAATWQAVANITVTWTECPASQPQPAGNFVRVNLNTSPDYARGITLFYGRANATPQSAPTVTPEGGGPVSWRMELGLPAWWNASQAQLDRTRYAAAHEFGHVLGFNHENDRGDRVTPDPTCAGTSTTWDAGTGIPLSPYDHTSIMNYCGPNGPTLSFWDTVGVQAEYGMPLSSFAGQTTGTPAVARNVDGRLQVFSLATNGQVVTSWQTSANGPFAAWSGLGFIAKYAPSVTVNADGRMALFVVDINNVPYYAQQQYANGPFGGWTSLGGAVLYPPVAALNADGRLEVFVVGTARQLFHKWQATPGGPIANGGTWYGFPTDRLFSTQPAVGKNVDGTMEIFGVNWADGVPFHARQVASNSYFAAFSSLGGVLTKWQPLAVARNLDGRLELFGLGYYDLAVYHWTQNGANSWYYSFGGRFSYSKTFAWMPSVFPDADGTLEIMGVSQESGLVRSFQIDANQPFTEFSSLRGPAGLSDTAGNPAVGVNQDGRREMFIQSTSGNLVHAWQRSSYRQTNLDGTAMSGLLWNGR